MKHSLVTLPEFSPLYPHLWMSKCKQWRIIRDVDNIQYIFQRWRNPKWCSLSYHVEYFSLVRRWANEAALPRGLSSVLNSTHAEPNNTNLLDPHSRCIV